MTQLKDAQSYLIDLVENSLDPGYTAAHSRRPGRRSRWHQPLTALGCLLAGFVLVVGFVHQNRGAPEAAKVHDQLVQRVSAAQQRDGQLARTAQQLDQQVAQLRDQVLSGSGGAQLRAQEMLAGTRAALGPGVRVTLSEPVAPQPSITPGRPGSTPITAVHIITDRDVRAVVNELWSAGAEAVAVNGVRLTAVSAIRFAGEAVLVDFQPVTSPYRIEAIGNADQLVTRFADSPVASRYQTLSAAKGIGFDFGEQKSLQLPASAPIAVREARPAR